MLHHLAAPEPIGQWVRLSRLFHPFHLLPAASTDTGFAVPEGGLDEMDPLAQMAHADAADASLLRLVLCAASATLALAIASSLL